MQKLQTISDLTKISPVGLEYLHKIMEKNPKLIRALYHGEFGFTPENVLNWKSGISFYSDVKMRWNFTKMIYIAQGSSWYAPW